MVPEHLPRAIKSKSMISREEFIELVEDKTNTPFISSVLYNIQKCKVDEQSFEFIIRKLHPSLQNIYNYSKAKNTLEADKLNLLTKAISLIDFPYDTFLEYFSDEDISRLFEIISVANERLQVSIRNLLEGIFNKFEESSYLFKEIISNRIILFKATSHDLNELEFNFYMMLLIIKKKNFELEIFEFYSQFILPKLVLCSLENTDLVKEIIEAVCSRHPECQRTTLRYLQKIYFKVSSNEQIKILELTSKVIHTNFFFQSNSFLEWEVCEIINLAASSESYIVVDAVIELMDNNAVRKFIQDHVKIVLPKIFDNLYKLSKKFWRQEQRYKAIKVIGYILNIDNQVFETCVIEYNKRKHIKTILNR